MMFGRKRTHNETWLIPMKINKRTWWPAFLGLLLIVLSTGVSAAQETKTFDVALVDGQVQDGITSVQVTQGDRLVIRWRTDHETEIHLHGYDLKAVVSPDSVTELGFEAHATGRFPITAHGHGTSGHDEPVLLHVEVYPN